MRRKKYTSSLSRISTVLPKVFKNISKKGRNSSKILELKMNWEKILGDELSKDIFVESIRKVNNQNTLIIISNKISLLEISFSSEIIKKKINNYFNEPIIENIKFKKSLHY